MNYKITEKEKDAIHAELKTEYIYIFTPLALLIMVRSLYSSWQEIALAPDWSLASCIIFGQITSKVSRAVANPKTKTSQEHFGLYTAKRIFLVVLSLTFYFFMLTKPTIELGLAQIALFITASYFHFSDGFTTKLLQKDSCA